MDLNFLEAIRLAEIEIVVNEIEKLDLLNKNILEFGAGNGWQAKWLSRKGFTVEAIEIKSNPSKEQRVWPIREYDGKNIPFQDNCFDIVFSSSVIEHIAELPDFFVELKRVLTKNGIAIFVVPSSAWRFWTIVTHYPYIIKIFLKIATRKFSRNSRFNYNQFIGNIRPGETVFSLNTVGRILFPCRHGVVGNALTELYYFSKHRWSRLIVGSGWKIITATTNRIFYSGNLVSGGFLPIKMRNTISRILGSSCHIFVLKQELSGRYQ
jgi:SAM-dependent methyltransferase